MSPCELIERHSFGSKAQARLAVFACSKWYNRRHRQSGLGYPLTPEFERSQQTRFNALEHDPLHAEGVPQMVRESNRKPSTVPENSTRSFA